SGRHGLAGGRDPGRHRADRGARDCARIRGIPHVDIWPGDGIDDDVASARLAAGQASSGGAEGMSETLLKVSGLTMRFGGLLAVDQVEFEVKKDEVFAI